MTFFRPALLALACLFTPAMFASDLPSLGDSSSSIISPEQEHQLGRAWLSILRGQVRQLEDPLLKDYIESSVYRLTETSQLNDRRLEFILLASPQLNAFAAPGGIIGVNGGLLLHAQTEAEYASVMAHELAHLSQRHFARGLEAQKRMQVPLMAAMLAGVVAAAAGGGDLGMAAIASTQAAAVQEQRRFSRQNEQEADRIGLLNLSKAGFDPRAMPSMFERLMRQYRYDRMPPEFLLTHPVSESRIADTRNRAEQYDQQGVVDSLYYQLIRARVQLTFEETPGLALKRFRSMLNEDPNLEAARYGLVLALIRASQLAEAENNLALLLKKNPNSIIYNLAAVDLELSRNQFSQARKRIDDLLQRHPNSFPLRHAQYETQLKQNDIAGAEQTINQLLKQRPNDPDIWFEVAEVRGLSNNIIGLHEARAEYFARVGDYTQAIEQLDYAKRRASNNFPLAARIDARQQTLINEEEAIKKMLN
ncbi:MAG: M48 family metallopeptidase [Gammaproteobacteria bacterium]|nr:M48 family metallopeptidase [Gammaproteobacteria bacterium]